MEKKFAPLLLLGLDWIEILECEIVQFAYTVGRVTCICITIDGDITPRSPWTLDLWLSFLSLL